MANNTDEKDIFFGGEAEGSEEKPAQSTPSAKEALAKQIAENMALNDKDDDDDDLALNAQAPVQKAPAEREVYHKSYSSSSDDEYRNGNRSMSSSKKKKKKKSHAVDIVCGIMAVAIVGGVIGAYAYGKKAYDGVFLANTTINKVDVSKLTPEQAVAKLTGQIDFNDQISITKRDGSKVNIDLKDLDLTNNIGDAVSQAFEKQDHTMWFRSLLNDTSYEFDPDSSFNDTKLNAIIKRNVIESQNVIESKNAYIEQTDDGFTVVKEVVGNSIDKNKLGDIYDYISSELSKGNYDISIADLDVYEKPTIVAEDLQEQVDSLNKIATIELKFDFVYEKATLKGTRFMDWLDFNEDGTYTVDKSEVQKYVDELAEKYDTYRKDRKFKSTNKGTITVEGGSGIYGWWLNTEPEGGMADYIIELIEDGKSGTFDPIFYSSGGIDYEGNPDCWTAEDDIGNTYLEIDFYAQHMWFYKNGKKTWECEIVSGLPTEGRNTPEGVYKLWNKESPSKLKGENGGDKWETTVSYWNNISDWGTQIGIHDATWQPYFGGELYKWSGSHGCINVSYESAKYVYENVPIGTPVVAYWE